MRPVIAVLSVCLIVLLACAGGAEFAYEKGKAEKDAGLVKMAQRLNPLVSDHFYEDYRLTGDLGALRRAMSLEPTKPAYPMYYGLALLKPKHRARETDREAVTEVCKAARLKPYSKQYREICAQVKAAVPVP